MTQFYPARNPAVVDVSDAPDAEDALIRRAENSGCRYPELWVVMLETRCTVSRAAKIIGEDMRSLKPRIQEKLGKDVVFSGIQGWDTVERASWKAFHNLYCNCTFTGS